jgi:hypothetical protein
MATVSASDFRKCHNIKSRAAPHVQCPFSASRGDYCSRHHKNPRPFTTSIAQRVYTRSETILIRKIQSFWKRRAPLRRYRLQGPAANALDLATNQTDLYSLEPVALIPKVYLMSFADERKSIWIFDTRTLVHSMATGFPSQNPYTRDELTEVAKARIHRRITWLRSRKYHTLHINTDVLTPEQIWNQAVLDVFLKIEALGYYVSCDWYHDLSIQSHVLFYKALFRLWEQQLGLSRAEKEKIVPGYTVTRLFRYDASDMLEKSKNWWAKKNLALIEAFATRGHHKEEQKMGAMYALMALVQVSRPAAIALPWIVGI